MRRPVTDKSVPRSDFYVYALFREDGITPFYIGKGRGNRMHAHEVEANTGTFLKDRIIRKMRRNGTAVVPKEKLIEGLTDTMAKAVERDLIALLGRIGRGGILANLTAGGDGNSDPSPESRARRSAANVASWQNPETRQKRGSGISKSLLARRKTLGLGPTRRQRDEARKIRLQEERARKEACRAAERANKPPRVISNPKHLNTPEMIAKRTATMRLPHVIEARSLAQKKAFNTPEAKAKRSAASRKLWAERREIIIQKRAAKRLHQ